MNAYNERFEKSRMSAGWPHDTSHYRFASRHNGTGSFPVSRWQGLGKAIEGVLALAVLMLVALALWGAV